MRIGRRALLVGPAALAAAAFAAPSDETGAFVERIYARGHALPEELSARLRALMAEDEARDANRLDFDWLHGGQEEPVITELAVHTLNVSGTASAAVQARFRYHGEERFRRFHLIREGGRWVVDDVRMHPEDLNLVEVLSTGPR